MNGNERAEFIDIVNKDSNFLMYQNLMDYSFLLIISKNDQNGKEIVKKEKNY